MTTDDLTRTIKKFTAANNRGPNSLQELQVALKSELNTAISEDDVVEELDKAIQGGFITKDDNGNFFVP